MSTSIPDKTLFTNFFFNTGKTNSFNLRGRNENLQKSFFSDLNEKVNKGHCTLGVPGVLLDVQCTVHPDIHFTVYYRFPWFYALCTLYTLIYTVLCTLSVPGVILYEQCTP